MPSIKPTRNQPPVREPKPRILPDTPQQVFQTVDGLGIHNQIVQALQTAMRRVNGK